MQYRKEWKNINRMAYPILLNYLVTSAFEIIDKAIIGHYSARGFAVVGIAASIIYTVTGALGVLSAAFHIIAAEEKGKQNEAGFESIFIASKNLTVLIGILFFIISLLGGSCYFRTVCNIQGRELQELLSYFYPASITVLQNMLIFQYSAYFRNTMNTRISLYSSVVSTGVNLFFDFSLVFGRFGMPQLGTAGVAWGSVIGLFFGLAVYQVKYYWETNDKVSTRQSADLKKTRSEIRRILKLYPALLGQEMLESTIFVIVTSSIVARLGMETMAVYNLLDTVGSTIGLPVYAYATATQTYALQKHAEGNGFAVKQYLKVGMMAATMLILLLCIFCGGLYRVIFRLIITDVAVIKASGRVLWLVFLTILAKVPYQIFMNYLQGTGNEKFILGCTAIGTLLASVGMVVFVKMINLPGIYLTMTLEYIGLTAVYIRK